MNETKNENENHRGKIQMKRAILQVSCIKSKNRVNLYMTSRKKRLIDFIETLPNVEIANSYTMEFTVNRRAV